MYCSKCKYEMTEQTSQGDKYYTCPHCGEVKYPVSKDKE
jgi:DNA-directed RNA polymerase subunit RPC12/RpoP